MGVIGAPRSASAILILSASVIIYMWWTQELGRRAVRLTFKNLAVLSVFVAVTLTATFYTYLFTAEMGLLGARQQQKLVEQSDSIFGKTPLGLVLEGRPQVFGAVLAIIDKPITGYGSWTAWQMTDYFYEATKIVGTDAALLNKLVQSGAPAGVGHSVILTTWLENSILAMLGLLIVGFCCVRAVLATLERDSVLAPYIILLAVSLGWKFFFSPFNVPTRFLFGFFLALYLTDFPRHFQLMRPELWRRLRR